MLLEDYLRKNNLSVKKFAKLVGVSADPITRLKRGLPVSKETAKKITKILGKGTAMLIVPRGRRRGSKGASWKLKRSPGEIMAYRIWYRTTRACNDPHYHRYYLYGEKGFKIGKKWRTFEGFFEDMGPVPEGMRGLYIFKSKRTFNKENCMYVDDGRHYKKKRPEIDDKRQMRFDEKGVVT
jgi:hypothetical protein